MTAESAAMLVSDINNILVDSNEEDQTTGNLGIVSGVLEDVVGLLNEGNFSVDEDVRYDSPYNHSQCISWKNRS